MNRYRDILGGYDLSTFPKLKEKDVRALEDALSLDIPQLVKQVILPANPLKHIDNQGLVGSLTFLSVAVWHDPVF